MNGEPAPQPNWVAPRTAGDAARVAALGTYDILDTPPEKEYEDLARLAAYICDTPIAQINFIDSERQFSKFSSVPVVDLPRDLSLCSHVVTAGRLLIVPDLTADRRFADHPLVAGEPHVRFYAGAPLQDEDGYALGTLCVVGIVPHTLSPTQSEALESLARQVMTTLQLRRVTTALHVRDRAIEAASVGIIICDAIAPELSIVSANPTFTSLTGYSADEVLGRNCRFLQGPDTDPAAVNQIRQAVHTVSECMVTILNYRKDGTSFWQELFIAPVRDHRGHATHFVGVQNDISQRRAAEEILQRGYKHEQQVAARARQLEAWRAAFLRVVSHEVRTPLGQIVGFGELLGAAGSDLGAAERGYLAHIGTATARLESVVQRSFDLMRLFGEQQLLAWETVEITHLVDLAFITVHAKAGARALVLRRTGIPSAMVTGDPQRLAQVIAIVLDNAIAAAPPETRVTVSVELTVEQVRLHISDAGPGVPEMIRRSLFAPARAEDVLSHWQGGLGLSLLTARRIAELHGGRLELESSDLGACVALVLPCVGYGNTAKVDNGTS